MNHWVDSTPSSINQMNNRVRARKFITHTSVLINHWLGYLWSSLLLVYNLAELAFLLALALRMSSLRQYFLTWNDVRCFQWNFLSLKTITLVNSENQSSSRKYNKCMTPFAATLMVLYSTIDDAVFLVGNEESFQSHLVSLKTQFLAFGPQR